jgi:hypothetical protein
MCTSKALPSSNSGNIFIRSLVTLFIVLLRSGYLVGVVRPQTNSITITHVVNTFY